jgi:hypothetical protein
MLVAAPAFVLLGALAVSETLDRAAQDLRAPAPDGGDGAPAAARGSDGGGGGAAAAKKAGKGSKWVARAKGSSAGRGWRRRAASRPGLARPPACTPPC